MNLVCRLSGHRWDHCRCLRCGEKRDEDHAWDGCVCRICGKRRDQEHDWKGCRCLRCGKTRDEGHDWNGCRCRVCGRVREEGHDWNGCKCRICGTVREEGHVPDETGLSKLGRWCFGMTLIRPHTDQPVKCRLCGRTMWTLKANRFYCPKCYGEVRPEHEPSDEPTLLKYRVRCARCGFDKVGSVSDGY